MSAQRLGFVNEYQIALSEAGEDNCRSQMQNPELYLFEKDQKSEVCFNQIKQYNYQSKKWLEVHRPAGFTNIGASLVINRFLYVIENSEKRTVFTLNYISQQRL